MGYLLRRCYFLLLGCSFVIHNSRTFLWNSPRSPVELNNCDLATRLRQIYIYTRYVEQMFRSLNFPRSNLVLFCSCASHQWRNIRQFKKKLSRYSLCRLGKNVDNSTDFFLYDGWSWRNCFDDSVEKWVRLYWINKVFRHCPKRKGAAHVPKKQWRRKGILRDRTIADAPLFFLHPHLDALKQMFIIFRGRSDKFWGDVNCSRKNTWRFLSCSLRGWQFDLRALLGKSSRERLKPPLTWFGLCFPSCTLVIKLFFIRSFN